MITVSLTTTKSRLQVVRYTLLSLLEQSLQPDRIVLSISSQPYLLDEGIIEIPSFLRNMAVDRLEIHWVKNTGPYRKLLPELAKANSNDYVITCDDDVIYGEKWLSRLTEAAEKHPDCIICGRARRPLTNIFGRTQGYNFWPIVKDYRIDKAMVPIGIAGVLYRISLIDLDFIFDESFIKIAPKQDDLWFKVASARYDSKVCVAPDVDAEILAISTPSTLKESNLGAQVPSTERFAHRLVRKGIRELKSYIGIPSCENDYVLRRVTAYSNKAN